MSEYRKKPVVIEAVKYLGRGNVEGHVVPEWMWDAFVNKTLRVGDGPNLSEAESSGRMYVATLEGEMVVSPGDYLIRGIAGMARHIPVSAPGPTVSSMEIECIPSLRDAPLSDPDQPPTPREHTSEQVAP